MDEEKFYKSTTKSELFIILEQFATLLKDDNETWVEKAQNEKEILKNNGII